MLTILQNDCLLIDLVPAERKNKHEKHEHFCFFISIGKSYYRQATRLAIITALLCQQNINQFWLRQINYLWQKNFPEIFLKSYFFPTFSMIFPKFPWKLIISTFFSGFPGFSKSEGSKIYHISIDSLQT